MKKFLLLAVMAAFVSGPIRAQNTISDAVCRNYGNLMKFTVLMYRDQGIPVGTAERIFSSEKDVDTRVFLYDVTRETYKNPDMGREFIDSGKFLSACVKIHRGY